MVIGVPKEIKKCEYRVAIVPGGVQILVNNGHKVLIERGAGIGSGISDSEFKDAGALIVDKAEEVWSVSEMVMKIKEPQSDEYALLTPRQVLYAYLHLAAQPQLTKILLEKEISSVAYETIELADGSLPLLMPMSEVAGRMATQVGARCLEKEVGGKGILLGGVPGVRRGQVAIIGGGIAGSNAAKVAIGLGAQVTVLDINHARLGYLDDIFGNKITTLMSTPENIAFAVRDADLVVGAVLLAGAKSPVLVSEELIKAMEAGSVVVDVAIDQGGCIATSRATTHANPVFEHHGVLHYGVDNIPGCVPRTSSYAVTNVTIKYALMLANQGFEQATANSIPLQKGVNTHRGEVKHRAVLEALAS